MAEPREARMPPHDREAERGLLGAILRNNAAIGEAAQIVGAEDFYVFAHQKLFEGAIALAVMDGKPVDIVTLSSWVKDHGHLEDCGGYAYIAELWDAAPSMAGVKNYAEIIRGKACRRRVIHLCGDLERMAWSDGVPVEDLIEAAQRGVFDLSTGKTGAKSVSLPVVMCEATEKVSDQQAKKYTGILTGWLDLDAITSGWRAPELTIIGARPSQGKTSLAVQFWQRAVTNGHPGLFFSLEQSRQELAERIFCMRGGVDSLSLRRRQLTSKEQDSILAVRDELTQYGTSFVCDTPGLGITAIHSESRRLKLQHDIRFIVLDYLQLVSAEDRSIPRHEQVAYISARLKHMARELNVPVIALAQLNRAAEDREKPRLSNLKDSGAIEQDADTVILLHGPPPSEAGDNTPIEVIVAKQRNGPTGELTLLFERRHMRFVNYAGEMHSHGL